MFTYEAKIYYHEATSAWYADAEPGWQWRSGSHTLCEPVSAGPTKPDAWKRDAYERLVARMAADALVVCPMDCECRD